VLSVLTRIEEEEARRQAREVWRRLKERSAAERRELFEAFPEMSTWAVVEVLCAESCLAAAHSAVTAGELGELALSAAARLPAGQRSHAQGYAWAFVGNARRVGGKLSAANEAFALAAELWQAGDASEPLCPLDASRLLDLEASLRRDERRPSEALALLMRAAQFPNMSPHARARLLIQQANVFEIMGESAKAIAALREAEPAVEGCQDARLLWTLRCGLIVSLCSLGRAAEGAEQLTSARVLTARHGNALDVLRFRWLESRVAAGLGRTGEAIELLSSVRAAFADVEIVYDAALATSELAALYLQIGRTASVKALIRQSMPIFNAGGIYPEAQKALTTFAGAVERDAVTLALAQRLVTYIRRVQHHSGMLPFEV
jgi:tetratricopeptide (TPR) repeat protein